MSSKRSRGPTSRAKFGGFGKTRQDRVLAVPTCGTYVSVQSIYQRERRRYRGTYVSVTNQPVGVGGETRERLPDP
jgi:hypothetical protein